jgi:hypothetical protein
MTYKMTDYEKWTTERFGEPGDMYFFWDVPVVSAEYVRNYGTILDVIA